MDDYYQIALDCHMKMLLKSHESNPEYYKKAKWMISRRDGKRIYKADTQHISALFIIDYMLKRNLDKLGRFTLHKDVDEEYDEEFYWIVVD
jgi:hypothetical protein